MSMDDMTDRARMWREEREQVRADWYVTAEEQSPDVAYVEAEAKTGSRYAVIVSRLPGFSSVREGGPFLVTVLQPWQDAWPANGPGLVEPYVLERLGGGEAVRSIRDLTALTLTINKALEVAAR